MGAMTACVAALVLAAPVPKPVAGYPTVAEVKAAFGQKYSTRAVRTLGQRCGDPEMRFGTWVSEDPKRQDGPYFYWIWKGKGLEAYFEDEVMTDVWFKNEGAEGFKRYGGHLPQELTFADDYNAVRKKLGPPEDDETVLERPTEDNPKVIGVIETASHYPTKGVEVWFRRSVNAKAGSDRIHMIRMFPATKP